MTVFIRSLSIPLDPRIRELDSVHCEDKVSRLFTLVVRFTTI